jgi:hypothetical protein
MLPITAASKVPVFSESLGTALFCTEALTTIKYMPVKRKTSTNQWCQMFDLLAVAERTCKAVGHTKDDQPDIMLSLMEEAGETATEIKIAKGLKKGPPGKDGVIGEAVDTILCALDVIYTENGTLVDPTLNTIFETKLDKWRTKYA